jgi:hypothetical protein
VDLQRRAVPSSRSVPPQATSLWRLQQRFDAVVPDSVSDRPFNIRAPRYAVRAPAPDAIRPSSTSIQSRRFGCSEVSSRCCASFATCIGITPRRFRKPLAESLTLGAGLLLWFYRESHARYGSAGKTGRKGAGGCGCAVPSEPVRFW